MYQELEKLNKALHGEKWQDNLAGIKYSPTIQERIIRKHQHELQIVRLERDLKKLRDDPEALREQNISDGAFAACLKSKDNPAIKEIGFNVPDDLILHNYGVLLAMMLQTPSAVISSGYTLVDYAGNSRTSLGMYGYTSNCLFYSTANGTVQQFGSSTTAAQRTDYSVLSALNSAPENTYFGTGAGAYANLYASCGNVIVAGGSGQINEMCCYFKTNDGGVRYAFSRIVLGQGVNFVAGNPLVGTWTFGI